MNGDLLLGISEVFLKVQWELLQTIWQGNKKLWFKDEWNTTQFEEMKSERKQPHVVQEFLWMCALEGLTENRDFS